jgi:hypothetical protein
MNYPEKIIFVIKKKKVLKYLIKNINYYLALVPRLAGDVFRFPPCVLLFPPFNPDII